MKRNEQVIRKIRENIPQHIRLRDYLADKLGTSRESAYRRIRGVVPFNFNEIADISRELGFSLDELSNQIREESELSVDNRKKPLTVQDNLQEMFREYYNYIEVMLQAPEHQVWMSARRLNLFFLLDYDTLFRFFYYRWIQRSASSLSAQSFSQIEVPDDIQEYRTKLRSKLRHIKSAIFILDKHLFSSFIREVEYYYQRKLLSEGDVLHIRRELTVLLNRMERQMKQVTSHHPHQFYLSQLEVENDSIYAVYKECHLSLYWLYPLKTLTVRNPADNIHRRWLESQKRLSALISGSNEILQVRFIEAQREAILDINNLSQNAFLQML
jgi:hypothetical protein